MQNLTNTAQPQPALIERWISRRCRVSPAMARLIAELVFSITRGKA